jgi:hypothetical protein
MLFMEELQEVRQMVTRHMEISGFVRPTLFLVGSKSRLGYTVKSIPSDLNEVAAIMFRLGQQLATEHPEVGRLVRVYFAMIGLFTSHSDEQEAQEVLIIHGVEIATNEQQAALFEVLRDRTQHSLPFHGFKEVYADGPIPEHPISQSFVKDYLSFD